ncbi:16S rRNA pseudouridine(516) synthase RsuA [Thalassotalea euphylliae]|uniref:16S rRNA pseudouridine(516) synthase RsuA n=1 Tax=Thalassotalea euphylliae TaxID=1655234 RepID=UPI0036290AF2
MRIDKYLCKSTELTRSEAKKLLKTGKVTIDGAVSKNGADKVPESAVVEVEGRSLSLLGQRYVMLYKPEDTICSNVDEVYPSVLHFIEIDRVYEMHIAGRLDADTTGLVLITDDGKWSHNVISPKKHCEKTYRVWLAEPLEEKAIDQFKEGVQLHGEKQLTRPAKLEIVAPQEALLTIVEGKYHQVKRMFAAIGNKVEALHRERIGIIELDEMLNPGEWRYLTEAEVNAFK